MIKTLNSGVGKYKIDVNNLSPKDRLLLFSYMFKILSYLQNRFEFKTLQHLMNGNPENIITGYNLLYSLGVTANYDYDFLNKILMKTVTLLNNEEESYINVTASKFTKKIKEKDLENILLFYYEEFFINEFENIKVIGESNFSINFNEIDIFQGLTFTAFCDKLILSICLLYGDNTIDYLFENYLKNKEEQRLAVFYGFLLMIDVNNKELDVYFKIINSQDYKNLPDNLLMILQYHKIFHTFSNIEETFTSQPIEIKSFITEETSKLSYNIFIDTVIKKIKDYKNGENKKVN